MIRYSTAILLTLVLCAATASAQDSWADHNRNGEWAFARGDYERAEQEFKKTLEIAQGFPEGDRRLETSLENLARFYEHRSDMDKAQPLYQLLLAAQENRVGEEDPELLDTLAAIGRVSIGQGDVPTAVDALEKYSRIADSSGAADPAQHGRMLALLARTLTLQERAEEALPLQRRAVELLDEDPSVDDLERAAATESLAQMEMLHGSPEEAERLILETVELRQAAGEGGDPAAALAAAAGTALSSNSPEVAERLAERSLGLAGDGDAALAARTILADAAWMRVARGSGSVVDLLSVADTGPEMAAAETQLESLYSLLVTESAAPSDAVSKTVVRLARVNAMQGDAGGAAKWLHEELELSSGRPGIDVREDLVAVLVAGGDKNAAVAENAALIAAVEATFGTKDPRLLPLLEHQEQMLKELKRKKEAKAVKKRIKSLKKALR